MEVSYWLARGGAPAAMVGKVLLVPPKPETDKAWVCCHEVRAGSQRHIKLDSPGGIDAVLLQTLKRTGVDWFHHIALADSGVEPGVYVALCDSVVTDGVYQTSDGRSRYYLPFPAWEHHPALWYDHKKWVTATKHLHSVGALPNDAKAIEHAAEAAKRLPELEREIAARAWLDTTEDEKTKTAILWHEHKKAFIAAYPFIPGHRVEAAYWRYRSGQRIEQKDYVKAV